VKTIKFDNANISKLEFITIFIKILDFFQFCRENLDDFLVKIQMLVTMNLKNNKHL
jgi:hypothetical protein